MASLLRTTLIASLALASVATAQASAQTTPVAGPINPQLIGTWSTKSNKVFTGPVSSPIFAPGFRVTAIQDTIQEHSL